MLLRNCNNVVQSGLLVEWSGQILTLPRDLRAKLHRTQKSLSKLKHTHTTIIAECDVATFVRKSNEFANEIYDFNYKGINDKQFELWISKFENKEEEINKVQYIYASGNKLTISKSILIFWHSTK